MIELVKLDLGIAGINYVRDQLSDAEGHGLRLSLSKYLLDESNVKMGSVWTLLPPGVTFEEATDFRGWVLPKLEPPQTRIGPYGLEYTAINSLDDQLARIIDEYLQASPDHLCVLENSYAEEDSPFLKRTKTPFVIFGKEVYHILKHGDPHQHVRTMLHRSAAAYPPSLAVMSSVPGESSISREEGTVTEAELRMLARQVEMIAVGAYDREGFVVWSKGAGPSTL